jgi:phosphatidylinositol glycan class B
MSLTFRMLTSLRPTEQRNAYRVAAGALLVLYLLAAWRSKGIWQFDEYFQLLEPMSYRLGRIDHTELPWEFQSRIRPWLQPLLYWCVVAPARALGATKPATWWAICRWVSALFGWVSVVTWARSYASWFPSRASYRMALACLVLCFFMPMLHARTSSENLSGATMMLALGLLVGSTSLSPTGTPTSRRTEVPSVLRCMGVGVLLGCAFEFRYQVGIMVAGALLWCLWYRRIPIRQLALVVAALLACIAACWGLDAWGYHNWRVFPAVGYVRFNLVQDGAASFGTSPWFAYFEMVVEFATPPIGVFLLVCFGILWVTQPSNLLTWVTLPFFIVHCAIGHKEVRFLFPALYFAPTVAALSVRSIYRWLRSGPRVRRVRWFIVTASLLCLVATDLFLLVRATMLPLEDKFVVQEKVDELYSPGEQLFTGLGQNPFEYGNLTVDFYGAPELKWTKLKAVGDVFPLLERKAAGPALLWLSAADYKASTGKLPARCHRVWASREGTSKVSLWIEKVFGAQYLPREDTCLLQCGPSQGRT